MRRIDATAMEAALAAAVAAGKMGEIPVGAAVSDRSGTVIAARGNAVEAMADCTAHAEMLALRDAVRLTKQKYLSEFTLAVTLEPCAMCAGAISAFRVKKLVFGAYDPKSGAVEHGPRVFSHATTHQKPEIIGGVRDSDCAALLTSFFERLRDA